MASGRDYLEFILEQLSDLDGITYRAMMGEYILYFRGRIAGEIYDNRLLIKPVPSANAMLPDAPLECPYEGAKRMILVENVDDREFLCSLFEKIYDDLPVPKKR